MADSSPDSRGPLIKTDIADLAGLGAVTQTLISAIQRGVGDLLSPWQHRRVTRAEQENARNWISVIRDAGLEPAAAELTLGERGTLRLVAQQMRQQENRELIGFQAVEEFKQTINDISTNSDCAGETLVEPEWIDRFWRLAQDISTAELQSLWGRVLARQCSGASKFSARALETLSTLSREEADMLTRMAACTCRSATASSRSTVAVRSINFDQIRGGENKENSEELCRAQKQLREAVGAVDWDLFGSAGILIESGWAENFILPAVASPSFGVGDCWFQVPGLRPRTQDATYISFAEGYAFSPTGEQIIHLIRTPPNGAFVEAIRTGLRGCGLDLQLAPQRGAI